MVLIAATKWVGHSIAVLHTIEHGAKMLKMATPET
jgi:hypothetical protein